MKGRLYRADLHYRGVQLHTASSGSVPALQSLYLLLDDGRYRGLGEVRVNIGYLNGLDAQQVLGDVRAALSCWEWSLPAEEQRARSETLLAPYLPPTRMLLDSALHDLAARRAGTSVAGLLGANDPVPVAAATNQTLFLGDMDTFMRQAVDYVARGFTQLKVRIGADEFDEDIRRLTALRERFGHRVQLAADVNGQWDPDEAAEHLRALAPFDLNYVEQPIGPQWPDQLVRLAELSTVPLMLDESVSSEADVDRIIALRGKVWAHLKLVKLGGIAPTVRAARRLHSAGIPFMVGQMNEGAVATAAALHVAYLTRPRYAELYGADGIVDDPASGLIYQHGRVSCLPTAGLGIEFDPDRSVLLQEF
ncbi:mandelate racemase/muconate lactonizing enzyme family protein [Martelella alba]|uniref:Mandelate racemase n=1 Tax=Martelella alba TaxID=2590451 RepID=A0ABY2SM41_9HYPH|nr:mandelate racemase/muconate lactonizing enzyme family protein [Martelella alba]TKI05955.1 mandelate racemase [Martelella alba]